MDDVDGVFDVLDERGWRIGRSGRWIKFILSVGLTLVIDRISTFELPLRISRVGSPRITGA